MPETLDEKMRLIAVRMRYNPETHRTEEVRPEDSAHSHATFSAHLHPEWEQIIQTQGILDETGIHERITDESYRYAEHVAQSFLFDNPPGEPNMAEDEFWTILGYQSCLYEPPVLTIEESNFRAWVLHLDRDTRINKYGITDEMLHYIIENRRMPDTAEMQTVSDGNMPSEVGVY